MSHAPLFRRVIAMDRRELWFRALSLGRREVGHAVYLARQPRWRREELVQGLRLDDPRLDGIVGALLNRQWESAHRGWLAHMARRPRRFILDPSDRESRSTAVRTAHPYAVENASRLGERIRAGRFDLLGYRDLTFASDSAPGGIDWHFDPVNQRRVASDHWSRVRYLDAANGDHKIVWELNRHQTWLALGRAYWLTDDERYRDAFVAYLSGWMANNPPKTGVNWASMLELSLRSISWLWALHFFAGHPVSSEETHAPWSVDLLLGLHRQLTLVEHHLSQYFSPNTHLLGEALGLYVVGRALPELRRARRWESLGARVLLEQSARQIHDDGGHVELSTHYHRYTLDFYLLALAVARETSDPRAALFAEAVGRLAECARTLADDNGRLPVIGDDDGGSLFPICGRAVADITDSLQLAAQLLDRPELAVGPPAEEPIWITGRALHAHSGVAPWPSTALSAMGYYVSRSRRGDHLAIDAGHHGFLNGGHAHADALALTLSVRGLPLLIDPGTGCYTVNPVVRDRFRSTRYHNTVTVDGRSQSIPSGPFHWHSVGHARLHQWQSTNEGDFFEGAHDAYAPVVHNRAIISQPGCWCVVDSLLGPGTHLAEAHWHVDPSWQAQRIGGGTVRIAREDGTVVWLVTPWTDCDVVHGSSGAELGWCAPVYGVLVPTSTIRVAKSATAPFTIVTVVVESVRRPFIRPLTNRNVPEGAIAFSIESEIGVQRLTLTPRAAIGPQASNEPLWQPFVFEPLVRATTAAPTTDPDINVEEGVL